MSWSGAIPREADQSDSRILIDACLERVRKDAGLEDESVLPPLEVLIGMPERTAPPHIEPPAVSKLALEPGRPAVEPESSVELGLRPASSSRPEVDAVEPPKPTSSAGHRLRWPVVLCGFIGFLFGGMALMRSPVGQGPAVQQVMTTAADHVGAAYAATVAVTARLASR